MTQLSEKWIDSNYSWLNINDIKSITVKLFFLFENFSDSNFAIVKQQNLTDMKKYLLLIGVIFSICTQTFASKSAIYMDFYKSGHADKSTTVRRSPMNLPFFYVEYDNETHQVEVTGDEEVMAQIFLSDENGNIIDYSSSINVVLNVPSNQSGIIIIRIESEDWIATGKITV
jgi:hypothetical protein